MLDEYIDEDQKLSVNTLVCDFQSMKKEIKIKNEEMKGMHSENNQK